MAIKMKDIAQELGVSISTVSRAMRNDPHVSMETRKRVLDAASKQHFVMKKTTSKRITYIIDKNYFLHTSNFYNPLIDVIEEYAQQHGYQFQFVTIDNVDSFLSKLDFDSVSGILMTSSYIEELLPIIKMHSVPVVFVDSYLPLDDTSAVLVDNVCGILKAVKYLTDRGHSKIGYLEGDLDDIDCVERLTGYKRGLETAGLSVNDGYVIQSKLNLSSSYQAMIGFLRRTKSIPTAFIGVNDMVTIGGMQAAKDFGLTVPEQMSFIGFDDIGLSNEVTPRLTTVHVDVNSLGMLSVQRLVDLMEGKPINFHKMLINPTVVERSSVATLRADREKVKVSS